MENISPLLIFGENFALVLLKLFRELVVTVDVTISDFVEERRYVLVDEGVLGQSLLEVVWE